jgi:hypothetical protein
MVAKGAVAKGQNKDLCRLGCGCINKSFNAAVHLPPPGNIIAFAFFFTCGLGLMMDLQHPML